MYVLTFLWSERCRGYHLYFLGYMERCHYCLWYWKLGQHMHPLCTGFQEETRWHTEEKAYRGFRFKPYHFWRIFKGYISNGIGDTSLQPRGGCVSPISIFRSDIHVSIKRHALLCYWAPLPGLRHTESIILPLDAQRIVVWSRMVCCDIIPTIIEVDNKGQPDNVTYMANDLHEVELTDWYGAIIESSAGTFLGASEGCG